MAARDEPGALREALAAALPEGRFAFDEAARRAYSTDNSRLSFLPDCVAWPEGEEEAAKAVKAANHTGTPVYVRGRGTSTTGSSLAEGGGMVLSTERMDGIVRIDEASRTATVGPGVITGDLAKELEGRGLFWPPDPSSAPYCSVGGNIATAAAGPRGVRYGGVRENVLAVRAVCGDGSVVRSGARVHKSSVGYDIARLLVGSEGTLAVVTEATLRLFPLPKAAERAAAAFPTSADALRAVGRIMRSRESPSAVEFVDEGCIELIGDEGLTGKAGALLLLEAEGPDAEGAGRAMESVHKAIEGGPKAELLTQDEGGKAWEARKVLSQRLRDAGAVKVNEDVAVPVPKLEELVDLARKLAAEAGFRNLNFGHAGLGNLHVNLLFDDPADRDRAMDVVRKVMEFVVLSGGSISGEHGIGIAKRQFLSVQVDEQSLALQERIKKAFDPNNILRPLAGGSRDGG